MRCIDDREDTCCYPTKQIGIETNHGGLAANCNIIAQIIAPTPRFRLNQSHCFAVVRTNLCAGSILIRDCRIQARA